MNEWLVSIRPKYAQAILAGEKTVEVRRGVSRWQPGDRLWLYATKPVAEVVGATVVAGVRFSESRLELWEAIGHRTALSAAEFMRYLEGSMRNSAIHLDMPVTLSAPLGLAELPGEPKAPQGWRRLGDERSVARLMADTSMVEYGPDMEALRTRLHRTGRAPR